MQWAIDDIVYKKRVGKAVINLSLGATDWGEGSDGCIKLNKAVDKAIGLDIPVVIAAGNEDLSVETACPARAPRGITVGASNQNNERVVVPATRDTPHWGSNYGSKVDIYAPGFEVRGARSLTQRDEYVDSGTSMATPHVSGIVASFLAEKFFTPQQIKEKLWEISEKAGRKDIVDGVKWYQSYLLFNGRPM